MPLAEKTWIETGVGFSSYGLNRTDVRYRFSPYPIREPMIDSETNCI